MPKARVSFAQFLSTWLEEHDVRQYELAADLPDVSDTRISRWVNGRDVPPVKFRDPLAERLGIEREELDRLCSFSRDRDAVVKSELTIAERAIRRALGAME